MNAILPIKVPEDRVEASDFDWTSNNNSIAVREQPAIAVYLNSYGQVTLRRARSWDEEDDCFIPIAQENVLTVVGAILRAAGMDDVRLYRQLGDGPFAACEDIDISEEPFSREAEPKPKDHTATERQRRCRANKAKRDTVTPERDSRDNAEEEPALRLVAAE
ncbi:MAG: hypothetical protein ACRECF_06540 [Methyloceanibacter sp.]